MCMLVKSRCKTIIPIPHFTKDVAVVFGACHHHHMMFILVFPFFGLQTQYEGDKLTTKHSLMIRIHNKAVAALKERHNLVQQRPR